MAININTVSEKLFNILKGFGYEVNSFNKEGKQVINPQEATRFAVAEPNLLARIDINDKTIMLATSGELSESPVRGMVKDLAQDYLLNFDYRIFDKKIKPKGENLDIAKNAEKDMADVMEASLGKMTGSTKTSYQPLDNVKVVVRHKKPVDEEVRGSRSRNIHSIFIQRGDERFKMAENNLSAARAMARHLYNGGEMYDTIGEAITTMAQDYRQLREFVRYVKSAKLVNETNEEYVSLALENIGEIKNTFKRLSGVKTYANAIESIEDYGSVEMLEDDLDLESKFTETHFDDKVANVMDNLKSLATKRKSFESKIVKAIESETFTDVKDRLQESDLVDFATPQAKLSHQVSQLGYSAKDDTLANYLHSISSKLNDGGQLSQFEYGAIKSCLLSANQNVQKTAPVDVAETYEAFLDQFTQ
jgi:hypothetical protein